MYMTQQTTLQTIAVKDIKPGMVVRVHQKIKEMSAKREFKERLQVFEGTVLGRRAGNSAGATFTVRKVSAGVGVERIYPIHSPVVAKVELVRQHRVRRAKLLFLKNYKKKLK